MAEMGCSEVATYLEMGPSYLGISSIRFSSMTVNGRLNGGLNGGLNGRLNGRLDGRLKRGGGRVAKEGEERKKEERKRRKKGRKKRRKEGKGEKSKEKKTFGGLFNGCLIADSMAVCNLIADCLMAELHVMAV